MLRNSICSLGLALGAAACSFDARSSPALCIEGQQETCECAGGRAGTRVCRASGSYGACVCDPIDTDAFADAGDRDPSVMPPDPGTTSPPLAGHSAEAGEGAAGAPAGGRGGTGGRSAPTAGRGGSSGTGASGTGSAGDGAGGAAGGDPEPGDPYTRCSDNSDCSLGLICAINTQVGQTAGYCTAFCDAMNAPHCPQPSSGTVKGECVEFANVCILTSCQEAECPDGMRCVQGPPGGPFGMSYNCEYRTRDSDND